MAVDRILVSGVTEILKKLCSVVTDDQITLVWDFKDELKKLQTTLNMIMVVMEDAEKKQVSSETVRLWMEELKSIAYDADDILHEYSYEIIMCKREKEYKSTVLNKVRKVFSNSNPSFVCSWKLAHKIKQINEKFNKIAKRKNDLGLQTIDVQGSSSSSAHTMMMKNRETYSLVAANWKIVGRENDKSKIINTLLDKDSCLVLSIVGLGGLGKTTMAQEVINDEAIKKHFQLKIWICVSDPFDVKKVLKNIANETGKNYDDAATMNDIVHGLQDALREKKFLLVLDDVWNKNADDWYKLKTPLMVGAEGSKILVTTRSVEVASIMVDKFPPYELGILNDTDSWSLFKELAFGSVVGAVETPKLVEIGQEMVGRCGGLPLALIFLGCLLRSKKKEEEWENIRNTKIWHESQKSEDRILPSLLRLSYDYLPSHLKQCFSYCCLFPKDYMIKKETLIRLWMGEGFLIESPGDDNAMSMEEIGNEYFQDLVSNFFFQDVERNINGDIVGCKMHDLVHDLARSVVGKNECLIIENADDIGRISEATIRLNLFNVDESMVPKVSEALKNVKNLRTVFVEYGTTRFDIEKVLNKNKRLRVLHLGESTFHNSYDLPHDVRKHCRWDDTECKEYGLAPHFSVGELKYLRYLHLPQDFIIPKGIGRLRFLQTLNSFALGHHGPAYSKRETLNRFDPNYNPPKPPTGGSSIHKRRNAGRIEELEGLNNLAGGLIIRHLERVTTKSGTAANLKVKKLGRLELHWDDCYCRNPKTNNDVLLEGLRPHPNLTTLSIHGFQGSKLPRWIIEDSSFCLPNLVELSLSDCECEQLAGFGALPSLKKLKLQYIRSLKDWVLLPLQASTTTTIGGGASTCFPLLEELYIEDCAFLTTIITPTNGATCFPSLKVLKLENIDGSAAMTLVTNNLNSLTSLSLYGIRNLITLPRQGLIENNNTLISLSIMGCHFFDQFEGFLNKDEDGEEEDHQDDDGNDDQGVEVGEGGGGGEGGQQLQISSTSSSSFSSLQSLGLYNCPALRFYPNIRSLTSLRKLTIGSCKISKSLKDELARLSSTSFSSLEHLEHVHVQIPGEEVLVWRRK